MKLSMMLTYSGDPRLAAAEAADLEKAGIDVGWVPELYGFDAVSILGYLAAKTDTMELGSGIFNIYGRTPSTIAMTAAGLDAVSSGRFILGLGASSVVVDIEKRFLQRARLRDEEMDVLEQVAASAASEYLAALPAGLAEQQGSDGRCVARL